MTENLRREGEYPQENLPQLPLGGAPGQQPAPWGEDWQRGRDRLAQDAAYPPPPAYPPAAPAPGWHEAHTPPVIQGETVPQSSGSGNGGWATWGEAAPAAPAPQGQGHARAKRPVALLTAVALAAAVVGGGTAAAVQQMLNKTNGTGTGVNGSTISQSSNGTVSGVAENVSPSVVRIDTRTASGQGTGSGVVITADGEIVTNNHVIDGASQIQVTMSDGKKYSAKTVGTDPDKDLALIKLEGASGLKPASLGNSDNVKVGDEVVAIGSPDRLTGTVTSGIVSALDREVNVPKSEQKQQSPEGGFPFSYGGQQFNGNTGTDTTSYKAIQTDASLNPGNSGGALVNMNGEIVGMPSAIYSPSSGSGSAGSVGLGFAIPVNTIKADLPSLRKGGPGGAGNSTGTGTGNTANGFGTSF
ncbi:S1C family serine protease [Streptomyces sp. AP-93]|uniref:S1C family serine protease n=1 Tax=Streptomyces sp. AP-93 TaxID=2929048 RepID=UPI001FAFCBB1|nr:trypsin-like peptidase domain-containing protein [Streptomyces sp. AP-93]MCJ0873636.1 trypsin-like peptidase domain-containing protein [Streptomyces sp. AP-93]